MTGIVLISTHDLEMAGPLRGVFQEAGYGPDALARHNGHDLSLTIGPGRTLCIEE